MTSPRRLGFLVLCTVTTLLCGVLLLARSSYAAPLVQALLPNFILTTQTSISVTVVLADGQRVFVPIDLEFVTRNEEVGGYVFLEADVVQQPGMLIVVEESKIISASLQAIRYVATQPAAPVAVVVPPTLVPPTPAPAPIIVAPTPTSLPAIPTPVPALPTVAPVATPTPAQPTGPTLVQACDADTGSMTDPQITAFANQYIGQSFQGWETWVYDVVSKPNGAYDLYLSKEAQWLLWSRTIVIENIPSDLATRLNVNQKLILSGRIARNEIFLDSICNPLVVDNFMVQE